MKKKPGKNGPPKKTPRRAQRHNHRKLKSVKELAAEQGVPLVPRWEDLLGAGKHLWKNDAEFEAFLAGIYERRKAGR